jgi:hypothetical protein
MTRGSEIFLHSVCNETQLQGVKVGDTYELILYFKELK